MRIHGEKRSLGVAPLLLVLALVWLLGPQTVPPVQAASDIYSEDFTGRTYKDESATNVTGWDSSVLRLPRNISWGSYVAGDWTQAVQVVGDLMYSSIFHPGGVIITNVSDPTSPQDVGLYTKMWVTYGMCVSGDYAYLAGLAGAGLPREGLSIVNVTDPAKPASLSNCTTDAIGYDVYEAGNYAYVGSDGNGLLTVNVVNPVSPTVVDQDDGGLAYYCLDGDGNYIYAGVGSRFQVLSINTPENPSKVGYLDLTHGIERVSVSGNYAYVACYEFGLYIINITTPASPNVVASYTIPGGAYSVFALGEYAYLGSYEYSLCVVDVSNPASPYPIGRWNIPIYNPDDVYVVADYAYVGFAGGVYVVDLSNLDEYVSPAVAQSLPVYSGPAGARLIAATLTAAENRPTGTSVSYYLSPDGGVNWEPVTLGAEHNFTNVGQELKWKAVFTTSDPAITPEITSLSISYRTMMEAPSLVAPEDDVLTSNNTPTFDWSTVVGTSAYLIQLDRVATFDSPDLKSLNVTGNSYTPATGLDDGVWYWRVAAQDSQNDVGFFSTLRTVVIDTTPPEWITSPANRTAELGSFFYYDLDASDAWGIASWSVNDTGHFAIDSNGVMTNATWLYLGTYWVEVAAYDQVGHNISAIFSVTVRDTAAPVWVTSPTNQVLEYGVGLWLDLAVNDFSRVERWEVNDTVNFEIHFDTGYFQGKLAVIDNKTTLAPGVYALTVTVYDIYDNHLSASFTVTVESTTTTTPPVFDLLLPLAAVGICAVLVSIVVLRRRRRP